MATATANSPTEGPSFAPRFPPAILIMEEKGTMGEGTRPTSGRFCAGCRPGALTRLSHLHNELAEQSRG